jgi:hypothetical protein
MRPQDAGPAARSGQHLSGPAVPSPRHPAPHPRVSPTIVRSSWSKPLPARGGRSLSTSMWLTWYARPAQATRVPGTPSLIATPASSGTSPAATGWARQTPLTLHRPSGCALSNRCPGCANLLPSAAGWLRRHATSLCDFCVARVVKSSKPTSVSTAPRRMTSTPPRLSSRNTSAAISYAAPLMFSRCAARRCCAPSPSAPTTAMRTSQPRSTCLSAASAPRGAAVSTGSARACRPTHHICSGNENHVRH